MPSIENRLVSLLFNVVTLILGVGGGIVLAVNVLRKIAF